jgi:hypothetical protein
MRAKRLRTAGPFELYSTNLAYRCKVPETGNYTDTEGSVGGVWTINGTRVAPPRNNPALGYGLDLDADIDALSHARTTVSGNTTIMWWAKAAIGATLGQITTAGTNGGNYNGHSMDVLPSQVADEFLTLVGDGAGAASSNRFSCEFSVGADYRNSVWHHMAYVFADEVCSAVWVDGTEYTPRSGDSGTGSSVGLVAGTWRCNQTGANTQTPLAWGDIADLRQYSAALSDAVIARIASGMG